jgi:transposase
MNATTIGLDIAKNVFHTHGVDERGLTVLRKVLKRAEVLPFFANLPAAQIGIEACPAAHFWARELNKLGHQVRLIPAQHVEPYRLGNKNDRNDAAAIRGALVRPDMRFAAINSEAQQDMQMLHRVRARLMRNRTALICQIRGLLAEYGIVFPLGRAKALQGIGELLDEGERRLSALARELLADCLGEWRELDKRIAAYDALIRRRCAQDENSARLTELPGLGALTATALVAAVGNAGAYPSGRHLAASLGLTPGEHSSGGKQRLLGMSKHGNVYVRTLLIHGARSFLRFAHRRDDAFSRWAAGLMARKGRNIAAVAVANKLARIAWVILTRATAFDPNHRAPQPGV